MMYVPGYIVYRHLDWAFVAWAAEARDNLFLTARYRRRATLLQANYISSEAEAEITRVVSRNLLRRNKNFPIIFIVILPYSDLKPTWDAAIVP